MQSLPSTPLALVDKFLLESLELRVGVGEFEFAGKKVGDGALGNLLAVLDKLHTHSSLKGRLGFLQVH